MSAVDPVQRVEIGVGGVTDGCAREMGDHRSSINGDLAGGNEREESWTGRGGQVSRNALDRRKQAVWGRGEMPGTLTSKRPCPRKSGGNDPPCSRNSEKGEDDVGDRETVDSNLHLDRPTRYSLHLRNVYSTS